MSSPVLQYEINFRFGVPTKFGQSTEQIALRGGESTQRSAFGKVALLGELQTLSIPPSLENKVLIVPKYNFDPNDQSKKLLVNREQVSFQGQDCNKIGTSYAAFNTQQ